MRLALLAVIGCSSPGAVEHAAKYVTEVGANRITCTRVRERAACIVTQGNAVSYIVCDNSGCAEAEP